MSQPPHYQGPTTARYLAKLTSPSGPLAEAHDALGHKVLVLKEHLHT